MKLNLKEHLEHKAELERLNKKSSDLEQTYNEEKNKHINKFWKLEQDLRDKKRAEKRESESQLEEKKLKVDEENKQHKEDYKEFNYILDLYDLKNNVVDLEDYKVYYFDYEKIFDLNDKTKFSYNHSKNKIKIDYKPLDILENKEHLNLKVYVVNNNKPKNKYSLIVVGKSFFKNYHGNKDIFENKVYSYGVPSHDENVNIRMLLKDFPSEKEALNYYHKNKDKILKLFREEHKQVEQDFKKVVEKCNSDAWEIESLKRKKYYYEKHYSNGEDTKEYKQIVTRLKALEGF